MSIRTKIIGAIVATALASPSAFAVEGSDGMYYTSASEGFYGSLRARINSGDGTGKNTSVIQDSGSSIGVQGTGEMAHGLEGFYRYELSIDNTETTDGIKTAKSFVGLRGGFGELRIGKHDLVEHDWVTARTDFTNNGNRPGTFNISDAQAIQYKSPDFNGLQVGAAFVLDGGNEYQMNGGVIRTDSGNRVTATDASDRNELDAWTIAGNYAFSGFNVGGSYASVADGWMVNDAEGTRIDNRYEDKTTWGLSGSYGQDNWTVATFYKHLNASDRGSVAGMTSTGVDENGENAGSTGDAAKAYDDETYFSIAGQVDVGKTRVIVTHDTTENAVGVNDSATTFEVEYRLNSKAKVWVGYTASDYDTDKRIDDDVYFGVRHDF